MRGKLLALTFRGLGAHMASGSSVRHRLIGAGVRGFVNRRTRMRALTQLAAATVLVAGTTVGIAMTAGTAQAATTGPCDIYASGGTPCVAAHSTTRALYGAYSGNLYQVRRAAGKNPPASAGVRGRGGVPTPRPPDPL